MAAGSGGSSGGAAAGGFNSLNDETNEEDDQVTDFSQKFCELNVEDVYVGSPQKCDDQVKIYYTEGTPCNQLSTASSFTDLREIGSGNGGGALVIGGTRKLHPSTATLAAAIGNNTPPIRPQPMPRLSKPIPPKKPANLVPLARPRTLPSSTGSIAQEPSKSVTFGEDNIIDTPLMFSRSSSCASLSSIDIKLANNIADDAGSVISEFSRRTSQAVSPSDLPDSPGQTMPSTPRTNQAFSFNNATAAGTGATVATTAHPPVPPPRRISVDDGGGGGAPDGDVFDERHTQYHVEDTPAHMSRATSFSDLSYDVTESNTPPEPPPRLPVHHEVPPLPLLVNDLSATPNHSALTDENHNTPSPSLSSHSSRKLHRGRPPPIPPKPAHLCQPQRLPAPLSSASSSDDDDDFNAADSVELLEQCISLGQPIDRDVRHDDNDDKDIGSSMSSSSSDDDSSDDDSSEYITREEQEQLLKQCISIGKSEILPPTAVDMSNCSTSDDDDDDDDIVYDSNLLNAVIEAGKPTSNMNEFCVKI